MKKLMIPLLALTMATSVASAADRKVVLQVSDGDQAKWNLALNNARNLQSELGSENVDIEIVVYGPGIGMLKADSLVGNRVLDAASAHVKVVACENTMKAQKLGKDDMLSGVTFVPAGVVEIMDRQKQGWSYIRP
ncbi:MAG: DsrE family protein [Gammaproteobacteria bacterium]|nr:DsrE family protein [Gammaproteobacteria bacterium]MBU1416679.1 DsrE family protein [Gammaproteobacteria bacterium]